MARVHHIPIVKRRREGKTDYRVRKTLLLGRGSFIFPRITGRYTSVQIAKPSLEGDRMLVSVHSKDLVELGWRGSGKSIPAAYLTGLLAGFKALKCGVKEVFLYVGVKGYIRGSRVAAVVKGVRDAGVSLPADEASFPSEERTRGEHIAEYARRLLGEGKGVYKARFSSLLKSGLQPEDYPAHFEEVRSRIIGAFRHETVETSK